MVGGSDPPPPPQARIFTITCTGRGTPYFQVLAVVIFRRSMMPDGLALVATLLVAFDKNGSKYLNQVKFSTYQSQE